MYVRRRDGSPGPQTHHSSLRQKGRPTHTSTPCCAAERPTSATVLSSLSRSAGGTPKRKEFLRRPSDPMGDITSCYGSKPSVFLARDYRRFSSATALRDECHGPVEYSDHQKSWHSPHRCHFLPHEVSYRPTTRSDAGTHNFFLPSMRAIDEGKLVVVLDLDETLVYSRNGPIIQRPGAYRLLDILQGRCEVIVWTAGERHYAMEVIRKIDLHHCIRHCVYRHERWWTEKPGYVKDITALGRPSDRTIIIDNTPDCLRASPRNSILVTDFRGESGVRSRFDTTLFVLADIIDDVLRGPVVSVEAFHHHPKLQLRSVLCDTGGTVDVLTLRQDRFPNADAPRPRYVASCPLQREGTLTR
ncbi:nuclear lim interactor-interacting factor [Trypanosoma grayi]|uniref:nuclear lim interactor-interacting factor n=1 Tax=Trypanosoma grayi TaxID=71804 RepID=UPI0004F46AC9|nr:nuclear lim interactor-interacting factor [Trypanosoma grayi]KEG10415.1 nuclear lim interactor-interacting factor [Trypanosoma grayi]